MNHVHVNGIEVAYQRHGQGTPLVLIHGFPLDHSIWNEVVPLLQATFDVIVPDLRGFGETALGDSPFTMDGLASDIAGLLDQLGLARAAVAGHSMGGYIALAFARNYPTRLSGLGLVATQTLADPPDRKAGRYKSAEEIAANGTGSIVTSMPAKVTPSTRLQEVARQLMLRQRAESMAAALKAMADRPDSTPLLAKLSCPVVVVHGNADEAIPFDRARDIKSAHPAAELVELPGVGHLPMLEAVEATASALKKLA